MVSGQEGGEVDLAAQIAEAATTVVADVWPPRAPVAYSVALGVDEVVAGFANAVGVVTLVRKIHSVGLSVWNAVGVYVNRTTHHVYPQTG